MKLFGRGCFSCLLLIMLWAGTGRSDCYPLGSSPSPVPSADHHGDVVGSAPDRADSHPGLSCACVAYTGIFKARHLDYARSPEFAAAVRAVAGGTSKYSPREIPAAWSAVAAEWSRHAGSHREGTEEQAHWEELAGSRADDGAMHLLRQEESLVPALVYLASMEYRSRQGRDDVAPVFPWILRQAHVELASRAAAKQQLAGEFSKRAAEIAAKISDAERNGAGDHAPAALARAKFELAFACREVTDIHLSVRETEAAFERAERFAETVSRI